MAITRAQQVRQMLEKGGRLGFFTGMREQEQREKAASNRESRRGGQYQSSKSSKSSSSSKGYTGGGGGGADAGGEQSPGKGTFKTKKYQAPPGEKGGAGYVPPAKPKKTGVVSTVKDKFVTPTQKVLYSVFPNDPTNEINFLRSLSAADRAKLSPALKAKLEEVESYDYGLDDPYDKKFSFDEFQEVSSIPGFADYAAKYGSPALKYSGNVGNLEKFVTGKDEFGRTTYGYREKRDGGQDQPIIPVVPTTTGIASATTGTTAASDTSDLDDYIAQMREGAAYRFFADGGRVPAQQGGIMPRLNELSGDVSSAEQMLQEINQRLESAESTLGGGGAMQQPAFQQPQLALGQPTQTTPLNGRTGGLKRLGETIPSILEGLESGRLIREGFEGFKGPGIGPMIAGGTRFVPNPAFEPQANNTAQGLEGFAPQPGGPIQSPIQDAVRQFADGGRADDEEDYVGGIMDLESARQMYGLGKLVKKVTRGIKKIAKSPVGKIALLAGGAGLLSKGGFGLPSFLSKKGLSDFFFAGKPMALKNLTQRGLLTGIGGLSAFAGLMTPKEQEEEEQYLGPTIDIPGIRKNPYAAMGETYRFYADGGKAEPVAKKTMPLLDMDGMEKDYRKDGGFVPIGRMERADDVPARLSKNEFVFTADAVRNAGDGDVDKGAEVMYNMMKNLEAGGEVSEESQGLDGARKMFQTSQRLEEVL